jgi:hypothetical protein
VDTQIDIAATLADRAKATGTSIRHNVAALATAAREKAGDAQAVLADALDRSAEAVRGKSDSILTARAGSHHSSNGNIATTLSAAAEAGAGAMERSALWLRENEIADAPSGAMRQLGRRPGRTALAVLGAAALFGGMFMLLSAARDSSTARRRLGLK